jgi:poly-gamma-glutamate synthesis protein (capsule biosynthesis protein)
MNKKLLALLLILGLLAGCAPAAETGDTSPAPTTTVSPETSPEATPSPTPSSTPTPTPTPDPEPITATLTVAGDIMSHMPQTNDAYVAETGEYDYTPMLRYAKPWVEQADLAVGNLETTFSGGPNYSGYPSFNTPDALGYALKDMGFDLLSTTNNHCLDRGFSGLSRTLDTLDEIGLAHVGTYRTQEERDENHGIVVADCGGISIAFLSYTYGTNGIPVPSDKPYSVNLFNTDYDTTMSTPDTALLESDMAAARELGCDLIAVVLHWGIEYQLKPNTYQQTMAQTMIDLGADLVLGGHPHVLEPYEFVTTQSGNTGFVCYSLGNFISSQVYEYTDTTVLLNLELKKDLVTGETTVEDVSYVPFYMLNKGEKIHGERMVLLDVYAAMAEYESGDRTTVTDAVYQNLQKALSDCHTILGEEGDLQLNA